MTMMTIWITDEQATWVAKVVSTGEILFRGSFDECQSFWRTSRRACVIRRTS